MNTAERLFCRLASGMCLLVPLLGCQGNAQRDIVERELRWQEEQIYALEDYLMEYQAKVRRLREENAALSMAVADRPAPEPIPAGRTIQRESPRPTNGRSILQEKLDEREGQKNKPAVPALEAPGIPPLKQTSQIDGLNDLDETTAPWISSQIQEDHFSEAQGDLPWITATKSELPWISQEVADDSGSITQTAVLVESAAPSSYLAENVMMEVELVGSEEELLVRLTPLSEYLEPAAFEGDVSLMLRLPGIKGSDGLLARWDFDPQAVADAWMSSSRGRVLEFLLELPHSNDREESVEVWTRMLPSTDSDDQQPRKILDHMVLEIRNLAPTSPPELNSEWAIAKPGEPDLLEKRTSVSTNWRSSTVR